MPVRISKNRVALENIPLNEAIGANIASASTINLTTATGNTVHLTGTTAITAVTLGAGMVRDVIFDGVLTLTHHSTNNNLPGSANIATAPNDRARYIADGTTVYCVSYQKADGTAVVQQTITRNYILLQEQQASGTHGGSSVAGWQTRVLNTEVTDTGGDNTLSANQFTLVAGTYELVATAPAHHSAGVAGHRLRIRNITDAATTLLGNSEYLAANGQTTAHVRGRFVIAVAKTFELQHYITNAQATFGLGAAISTGETEVYATVELRRVA